MQVQCLCVLDPVCESVYCTAAAAAVLLTQQRLRSEYSGHVSSSSTTRMTNMYARQRPWCTLCKCSCFALRKVKVPTIGSCRHQQQRGGNCMYVYCVCPDTAQSFTNANQLRIAPQRSVLGVGSQSAKQP